MAAEESTIDTDADTGSPTEPSVVKEETNLNSEEALEENAKTVVSESEEENAKLLPMKELPPTAEGDTIKPDQDEKSEGKQLKKEMTLWQSVPYIVGGIIGSGIFITPHNVLENAGSFGLALIAWTMGSVLAVCGGLCYCELGLIYKNSGGEFWFLKQAYNFGRPNKV